MTALKYRAGLLSASEHRLEKSKNTLRTQDFQISISTEPVHQVLVHGFQWPNSSLRCNMKVAQNFVLIWLILTHFCYLCAVAMKGQIQCKLRKHHQIKKKCCKSKQKKTELKKKTAQKRQQKCFGEDNNVREHFLKSQANSICTYGIICIIRLIPSTESSVSFNHATEPWVSFTSAANV